MINATHWLGALTGVVGIKYSLVRVMIHAAASRLETPVTLVASLPEDQGPSGLFINDYLSAWSEAAEHHIRWLNAPIQLIFAFNRSCIHTKRYI
jgi:hypothetical protein